jgi:hypothetical protein
MLCKLKAFFLLVKLFLQGSGSHSIKSPVGIFDKYHGKIHAKAIGIRNIKID